jgi:hypothetical protein
MSANTHATSFEDLLNDLVAAWKTSPEPSGKVSSYFPVYVQLFQHLWRRPCVFIETGILDGGSLFMWRKWLGDQARIVGIDLNPGAVKWRNFGFDIYIGDQADPAFWRETLHEIGQFDAFLDDGGHQAFQQIVTLTETLRFAKTQCVIAIEDTYSSFMVDFGFPSENSFIEYAKASTDCLIGRSFDLYRNRFPSTQNVKAIELFRNVLSVQFFEGIVCFHVNPTLIARSEVIRNRTAKGAVDFRYEGKNQAEVEWPNVLVPERRVIKCGEDVHSDSASSIRGVLMQGRRVVSRIGRYLFK